jgi:hypothetical protein
MSSAAAGGGGESGETKPITFVTSSKEEEYKLVLKGLDKFFAKYEVDTVGRMATIK